LAQFHTSSICRFTLRFAPKHKGVDERLRFLTSDVTEGRYELVKAWVCTRPTYFLNVRLGSQRVCDALIDLPLSVAKKLILIVSHIHSLAYCNTY
jgi:hypothetical protein